MLPLSVQTLDPRELPATRRLDELAVSYAIHRHPPLYTVAEAKALRGDIDAAHVKNLFLRDKREQMWMVTVLESRSIDTKELRGLLGASGTVSFGSHDRLRRVLGIEPGSVSPLALVNDPAGSVRIVLDAALRDHTHVGVHPLHNEATLRIAVVDLVRFLEASGRSPIWM
ncbi:MAG: prolyl-tRNA synthetase associated domain-containing protein [Myxococcales bacterium]|nr:prolyl-tRNA synthetase associated domain-containing protein [Myxococcales bacterium]